MVTSTVFVVKQNRYHNNKFWQIRTEFSLCFSVVQKVCKCRAHQNVPHLPAVVRLQRLESLVAAAPDVLGTVVEPLQKFVFFPPRGFSEMLRSV